MEEKESKVQKVKQYILRNKVLVAIMACLVIIILGMSGAVSSAVNEQELMSDQLLEQTEQYEDLQSKSDILSAQYDDLTDAYDTLQAEIANYQDQQETIDTLNAQLTDLQENNSTIIALEKSNGKLENIAENLNTFCWSVDDILYNVFHVRNTRNYAFETDIYKLLNLESRGLINTPLARDLVVKLSRYTLPGNDPLKVILEKIQKSC